MTENTKDIRNKIVKFRLSETEYNELKDKAKALNMTIASYVRQSCDTCKVNIILKPQTKNSDLTDLIYEIKKIGVNINQIAHRLNSGDNLDASLKTSLENMLSHLTELKFKTMELLETNYEEERL